MSKKTCPVCKGKGGWWIEKDGKREWVTCDWCNGTGEIKEQEASK